MKTVITTKAAGVRAMAIATLMFGIGFGASAFASDPFCVSTCQEITNDCIAQAGGGSIKHCSRVYRDCLSGCEF